MQLLNVQWIINYSIAAAKEYGLDKKGNDIFEVKAGNTLTSIILKRKKRVFLLKG